MSLGKILLVTSLWLLSTFGQASIWSMPICNQGPLKCLLQFHHVLQFRYLRIFDRVLKSLMMFILIIRFHYDFIKGVDRYVTGRDAIIEDKEIEQYVEESKIIEEEIRHQVCKTLFFHV